MNKIVVFCVILIMIIFLTIIYLHFAYPLTITTTQIPQIKI